MTSLRVILRAPGRLAFADDIALWLKPVEGPGRSHALEPAAHGEFRRDRIEPGRYELRGRLSPAQARAGWQVPVVELRVRDERAQRVIVGLGKPGWPYYPLGDGFVSFEPRDDRLAIAFEAAPPPATQRTHLAARLHDLGYRPAAAPPLGREQRDGRPVDGEPAGSILLLEGAASLHGARRVEELLQSLYPKSPARVGVIAAPPGTGLVLLDRRCAVRLASPGDEAERRRRLAEAGAHHLRTVETTARAMPPAQRYLYDLVELPDAGYRDHLRHLAELRRRHDVDFAEPDLVQALAPAASFPDDPGYGFTLTPAPAKGQFTLALQAFPEAWALLHPATRSGAKHVTLGILDEGFGTPPIPGRMDHVDAPAGQVAAFHDFYRGAGANPAPAERRAAGHGDKIWGILGAAADNQLNTTGLAPSCALVLAERPTFLGQVYCDVLLWLGGLSASVPALVPTAADFGTPSPHPVDVFCCAHELVPATPTPSTFSLVAAALATQGRSGKGCPLVYAAGNAGQPLVAFNALAEDPHTIAVGNCTFSSFDQQISAVDSNFGDALDLCALGDQALTLHGKTAHGPWHRTWGGGGTSAACATVAGAVALLLADQPAASAGAVRAALRGSALDVAAFNAATQKLPLPAPAAAPQHTARYGYGLLHVARALRSLRAALAAAPAASPPSFAPAPLPLVPSPLAPTYFAPTTGGLMPPYRLESTTQVRLAAAIYGDTVHERDLATPPPTPNWSYDPKPHIGGHQNWVRALFSGDPLQVEGALGSIGVADRDREALKAAVSLIDTNIALTVYQRLKDDMHAHHGAGEEEQGTGSGGSQGHTY